MAIYRVIRAKCAIERAVPWQNGFPVLGTTGASTTPFRSSFASTNYMNSVLTLAPWLKLAPEVVSTPPSCEMKKIWAVVVPRPDIKGSADPWDCERDGGCCCGWRIWRLPADGSSSKINQTRGPEEFFFLVLAEFLVLALARLAPNASCS